jgi:2',3'-cyclic-nucleotide 2'-phosphodiesterase/3'-nucleotidase
MSKFLINLNVVENYTQLPIGQITKSISSKDALFGPSAFIDLIHKAQLELTSADISFSEPLSFNTTIDSGWIRVGDMFKLYHYENFIYTMELTGQEVKDYLEYSFGNWFNQMKDGSDHLLKFKYDDDGEIIISERYNTPEFEERFYNYSSAAGINYTVDVSKAKGERVTITALSDGTVFSTDAVYTVAVNSYRGNGGGGHLTRGAGIPKEELNLRIISSTDRDLRYLLKGWIEKKKLIPPAMIGNWKVVPYEWWKRGGSQDYKLLFGTEAPKTENKSKTNEYR